MSETFDVCIRGAGITGRTLALLLAQQRLRVALVDRDHSQSRSPSPDVRAYALNAASRTLLESLRVWPAPEHATPVLRMDVRGDDSGRLQFDARHAGADALGWIVDVPVLEHALAQAIDFQPMIERINAPVPASLTAVCEGRSSSTRAEFGVEFDALAYPHHALAARLNCTEPHGQTAHQWFSDGQVLALLPMGGAQGRSAALVWSVQPERCQQLLVLPAQEFCATLAHACGNQLGDMTLLSERVAWPLLHASAQRWVGAGWALVGDAAHAVHPLAGQGLNLGLADVAQLAQVLSQREYWRGVGDERLLRRYERARRGQVALVGGLGHGLQGLFHHTHPWMRGLRNTGMSGVDRSSMLKRWLISQAGGL